MTGTNKIIAESNAANMALSITMKIIRGANAMYSIYHRHMGKKDTAAYNIGCGKKCSRTVSTVRISLPVYREMKKARSRRLSEDIVRNII